MGRGKDIVLTLYGHKKIIDKFAVSSFDGSSDRWYDDTNNARIYCDMINAI